MSLKKTKFNKKLSTYYRWFRRCWYYAYLNRVRQIEQEIGGELHAC